MSVRERNVDCQNSEQNIRKHKEFYYVPAIGMNNGAPGDISDSIYDGELSAITAGEL